VCANASPGGCTNLGRSEPCYANSGMNLFSSTSSLCHLIACDAEQAYDEKSEHKSKDGQSSHLYRICLNERFSPDRAHRCFFKSREIFILIHGGERREKRYSSFAFFNNMCGDYRFSFLLGEPKED